MINNEITNLLDNTKFTEKIAITIILLLPLSLTMSIFIADLFSVILSIIFFSLIFNKDPILSNILYIKKSLVIILLFFFIVLVSLIFSNDFSKSFLPSFFYFRYFLMSLIIYVYICRYNYLIKLIMFSLLLTFLLIFFDSIIELMQIKNWLGLEFSNYRNDSGVKFFITSFFNDEKKLGSYLVRLLPLILSLIIYNNYNLSKKINSFNFLIIICAGIIFLTSERTAFFLFILIICFLIKFLKNKIKLLTNTTIIILILLILNPSIGKKYFVTTLAQLNVINHYTLHNFLKSDKNINITNLNYISEEHEKLILSGLEVFKENLVIGSGIKTYHEECNKIKKKGIDIVCSTHPHNTYIQLLASVGLLGFLIVATIFLYIVFINIKILKKKNPPRILISFYILNIGIIVNLMPFIPSGSFFNNWINLMIYYPLGFWFFLNAQIQKKKYQINGK